MPSSTNSTIADALDRYLAVQLRAHPASRAFFRISGFSADAYASLLDRFARRSWRIGDMALEVCSIAPIAGHVNRMLDPARSATWYRNSLGEEHALVLIQNRLSTDAQSLKDLYPVTELSLSHDGLPQLIEAAFANYQLGRVEYDTFRKFVRRLAQVLFEPQLRDLVEFMLAVDHMLHTHPGTPIAHAIVSALPQLGLFRCLDLEPLLNTVRGDKLIRQLRAAARIGGEVIDERTRSGYLDRLANAALDNDDAIGGLTADHKRDLLRQFIEGQLRDNHDAMLRVLQIEWREVQLVITAKSQITRREKLITAASHLAAVLPEGEAPSDLVNDVIADLQAGREPDGNMVDDLLVELGGQLPRAMRSELRRLVRPRSRKHSDFLAGLTALAVELLQPLQVELQPGTRLTVTPNLAATDKSKHLPEAIAAFRALFGGVEQAISSVDWRLAALWEYSDTSGEEESDHERDYRVEISFRVSVSGSDEHELARAELIWQYRSDSPIAATALTLAAEHVQLRQHAAEPLRLRIPVFNSCPRSDEIGDLDLSHPIRSRGAWFEQPSDLRARLQAALQQWIRPQAKIALEQSLTQLEHAWGTFVSIAAEQGLLAANSEQLLAAYEALLLTAATQLRTGQEVLAGYRVLNQAWIVGQQQFERWAVMPLLHPLKLLWWRERTRYFSTVLHHLLDPGQPVQLVDEPRYRRELATSYGSSQFPPMLALPTGAGLPARRFLPVDEADGYEIFFRAAEPGEPFGLDTSTLADDEAEIAAQRAVEGITAVIQDYIETYPFVRDGLEIVLFECRNGALPGLLVEQLLAAATRRSWQVRLSVIVHTTEHGASLFQRVSEWVAAEQATTDRRLGDYFPPVSLKVLQCSYEELLRTREDSDMIILADVLAERGQRVASDLLVQSEADVPLEGYLPLYRAQQEPFQQGDIYRRLQLSRTPQPALVRLFQLTQHASITQHAVDPQASVEIYRELSLTEWERDLGQLHDHFNWVICYDPTIDRFLLKSTFPDKVQVIRYSLGLGAKQQHNLTVSSSHKSQQIVERRLAARFTQMLPNATPSFLAEVARRLVEQANRISGDIVLRAAGPGAFLNELIGLVLAKFETERRYRLQTPDALTTWILLDDFEHWFGGGKFPDLLFVAISRSSNGSLQLHLEVLEAKCVGQLSFEREATDAEVQVRHGISRLAPAFAPELAYLDSAHWYDQLYRAVAGNLEISFYQQPLWELFRTQLYSGAFERSMEGHAWAFCYNGQLGGAGSDEYIIDSTARDQPGIPLFAHHYGRNELSQTLRTLIEAAGHVAPEVMWTPAAEEQQPIARTIHQPIDDPIMVNLVQSEGISSSIAQPSASDTKHLPPGSTAAPTSDPERQWLTDKARDLERALRQRGVQLLPIDPAQADVGPSIVRFKLRLRPNELLRKIQGVAEDLARDLALASTPIIANVLRTNFVGVDIPREHSQMVELGPLLEGLGIPGPAELPIVIGVTPDGALVIEDLSEFPHLLVAGATNSGKSVFLRSMLLSLMTQYPAGKLELLIVDPKRTDFTFFNSVPYLRGGKVIIERNEARDTLLELVRGEMPRRQDLLASRKTTKVKLFNQRYPDEALPPIVALIDEYALLVSMMSKKERESFEQDLMILASAARSVSIHLVLATQRPSADIVTSTLKANLDARIAFRVASSTNSTVVLDTTGAENLLGRGDMLFRQPSGEIVRLQAPFMDEEQMQAYIAAIVKAGAVG